MNRILPKSIANQERRVRQTHPKDKVYGWCSKSCSPERIESLLIEIIVVWLVWAILWSFLQNNALPGTYVFGIAILTSMSYVVGAVVTMYTNLQPGHFMIGLGILARRTFLPELKEMGYYYPTVMDYTKRMAYVVFLLRAGLGTNLIHIKHYSTITIRLICIPLVIKVTFICLTTKFALGIPWEWALLTGIMAAPSSPINVFTTMSLLREHGYSPHNEIHSVMIFSSVIDNLVAVCVCVCIITHACTMRGWWGSPLVVIPGQVIIGSVMGMVIGFIGIYVPSNNNAHADTYRCLYFITSSFCFIFMLGDEDYRGASFLAAYISPLVATTGWKRLNYYDSVVRMRNVTTLLWSWTQPFLFALIGAEINIMFLGESRRLIFIGVYLTSLPVNFSASVLATIKSTYSWKQQLLIWVSRVPKGTVEVAVGLWIMMAVKLNFPDDKTQHDRAQLIIDCCVLAFFISGPLGGFLTDLVGRKVLKNENRKGKPPSDSLEDNQADQKVNLPSAEGKTRGAKPSQQIV